MDLKIVGILAILLLVDTSISGMERDLSAIRQRSGTRGSPLGNERQDLEAAGYTAGDDRLDNLWLRPEDLRIRWRAESDVERREREKKTFDAAMSCCCCATATVAVGVCLMIRVATLMTKSKLD